MKNKPNPIGFRPQPHWEPYTTPDSLIHINAGEPPVMAEDARIVTLKDQIRELDLAIHSYTTRMAEGDRSCKSALEEAVAEKRRLEAEVSSIDLALRREAGAEERRRMDQERIQIAKE